MDDKGKFRRRWFRFSLRTLLLLMTFCSLLFGWLGQKIWYVQRQMEMVAGLRNVAVQLETLGKAEGLQFRRDEDQTNIREETLDESLRASIEA